MPGVGNHEDRFSHDAAQKSETLGKPTMWCLCPAKTQISFGILLYIFVFVFSNGSVISNGAATKEKVN